MKSVSEWLSELDTHGIYDAQWLASNFKEETGKLPDFPKVSYEMMLAQVEERGLGGHLEGKPGDMYTDTTRAARELCERYGNGVRARNYHGRGSQVRAWIEVIKTAEEEK